jgi:hypothetical protein
MAAFRVRVTRLVGTAYRDFAHVLLATRVFIAVAVAVTITCGIVQFLVSANLKQFPLLGASLGLALDVVETFLLTPVLIALHRFIILNEASHGYVLDTDNPRFLRFFLLSLAITAFSSAVALLQLALPTGTLSFGSGLALNWIGLIIVAIVVTRLAILFPAIAVDAQGATVSNALADTKGHTLEIFLVFVLASVPLMVGVFALTSLLARGGERSLAVTVTSSAISAVTLPLFVALASRLFQALAERLVRPVPAEGGART